MSTTYIRGVVMPAPCAPEDGYIYIEGHEILHSVGGYRVGKFIKAPSEILDFHNDVDRVAHMMCDEMGIDATEIIEATYGDDWTPFEFYGMTGWAELDRCIKEKQPKVKVERWRVLRPDAARVVAGYRAMHKYILTEK